MKIEFGNAGLRKLCSSEKNMRKEYGPQLVKKLQQRLADLEAAASMAEVAYLPGRLHELTGARKGQFAMDLAHPMRLVFAPAGDPVPRKSDGGIDLGAVTAVCVLGIVDYH